MLPRRTTTSSASAPDTTVVEVARLPHGDGLALPAYQTAGSAGADLVAAVPADAPLRLEPGARALVPTGLALAIPAGFEAQVRPRSGLALKHGVTVLNSPGTIDSDYRGEVNVLLVNLGDVSFDVRRGERIAQLVVARVVQARLEPAESLGETARGAGGFGSTGRGGGLETDRPPARKKSKTSRAAPAVAKGAARTKR